MEWYLIILTIVGLSLFEIVSSIDNAIINTNVLKTMKKKSRKWFFFWGIIIGVFLIRGILPWLIVWFSSGLGPLDSFTATFNENDIVINAIENSSPNLLMAGGIFLILLFLHWLLRDHEKYFLHGEKFFKTNNFGFYLISLTIIIISLILSYSFNKSLIISILLGSIVFFITLGIKSSGEIHKKGLEKGKKSDIGKLFYLEVIDAAFSVDNVIGAFAFTLSIPIILIGNGIGALIVRRLTIKNIHVISKYHYLINGAMYSMGFLGILMILHGWGINLPGWIAPIITILTIIYFFYKSKMNLKINKNK